MSQMLATNSPQSMSKKQKIVAAISLVIVGHVGLLWGVSQMEPITLKPLIPPKPIQVRLIQAEKKSEPKPVEPPKPKEVKIVEKTPPPPPKKVEKVEQVKKEVAKPKVVEPPKQTPIETPTPIVPVVTQTVITPKPVIPKPVVPNVTTTPQPTTPAEPVQSTAPAVDMTPRDLGDAAGVNWKRKPKPVIDIYDLEKATSNVVILRIDVDAKGKIKARVVSSSGNAKVDREMVRAVQAAQFEPYKENGVAVPFFAQQSFTVKK